MAIRHDFIQEIYECFPMKCQAEEVKSANLMTVKVATPKGVVWVWFTGGIYNIEWSETTSSKTAKDFPGFYSGGDKAVSTDSLFDLKVIIKGILN